MLKVDVYAISMFTRTRENEKTREEYFRAIYNKIGSSGLKECVKFLGEYTSSKDRLIDKKYIYSFLPFSDMIQKFSFKSRNRISLFKEIKKFTTNNRDTKDE